MICFATFLVLSLVSYQGMGDPLPKQVRLPLERVTQQQAGTYGQPIIRYYANVSFGQPAVSLKIQFDVDSQEHFLLPQAIKYQCDASSSCKKESSERTFTYQGHRLEGVCHIDSINLANAKKTTNTIECPQNFRVVEKVGESRLDLAPIDGVIGLGPKSSSSSTDCLRNYIEEMKTWGHIDKLVFTVWLSETSNKSGEITFGEVDNTRVKWFPLAPLAVDSWQIKLDHAALGINYIGCGHGEERDCYVKFSTGLSDSYAPKNDAERIYEILKTTHSASGLELVECDRIPTLPSLEIYNGINKYTMRSSDYIRKMEDEDREVCYVAILPSDERNTWTLGQNFFNGHYVAFDMERRQVGIAEGAWN